MAIWEYPRAEVLRVIDGDTFWARIDHGCRIFSEQKVRLKSFSSPELRTDDPAQRELAEKHKRYLESRFSRTRVVRLKSYRWTYDRLEADVYYLNERGVEVHLNIEMRNIS